MKNRKQSNPIVLALLVLYIAVSATYQVVGSVSLVTGYLDLRNQVKEPFEVAYYQPLITQTSALAAGAGLEVGDTLLSIGGHLYEGRAQVQAARWYASRSEPMRVEVRKKDGRSVRIDLPLEGYTVVHAPGEVVFLGVINILMPALCLLIGYWVVLARLSDPNAWLILAILTYPQAFISFSTYNWWPWWLPLRLAWHIVVITGSTFALFWLGIRFPEKSRSGLIPGWARLLLSAIQIGGTFLALVIDYVEWYTPGPVEWAGKMNDVVNPVLNWTLFASVFAYGITVWDKLRRESDPDSKRRLKILWYGSSIGLGSVLFIWEVLPLAGFSPAGIKWLGYLSAVLLLVFPLSLAYVVVVQRAMDLRLLVRMGTQYALARTSITLVQVALVTFLIWKGIVPQVQQHPKYGGYLVGFALVVFGFVRRRLVKRGIFDRLRDRVDRHFFREAYDAEIVLGELVERVRTITDPAVLVETVSRRIEEVMHVTRTAVLVRQGDTFRTVGMAGGVALLEASFPMRHLAATKAPTIVYREDPDEWLLESSLEDRAAIVELNPEVLVPLPGRSRLMGVMALGPKLSEEPYTDGDLRLLSSLASQTGLGLEVSDMVETLAKEAVGRQRMQREMEIAREVQERLFPLNIPKVPGIELAGHCRPALGVGGDYYDMIELEDGRLGIAIGDVSGKGIGAALLMASLRASLRGMTDGNSHDLARMVRKLNRLVYESSTSNRYATFFFGIYDPKTRKLDYVNGGHNAPAILRGTEPAIRLEATGAVVGLLKDVVFEQESVQLQPGDLFIAYTDGISEAMTFEDEEWGDDRMIECAGAVQGNAASVLNALFEGADKFTAGAPQHDDMTVLLLGVLR